jgi:CHRD domain
MTEKVALELLLLGNKEYPVMWRYNSILRYAVPVVLMVGIAVPGFAAPITFTATLSGANENPVTGSPGTGSATVLLDMIANTLEVNVTFSDLVANNTAAHIHCCAAPPANAGVATVTPTFTGFPSGTSGSYSHVFDMSSAASYNPAFITAQGGLAQANIALFNGMLAGQTYLNIHSTTFPGGEIRGFLQQVPDSSSLPLLDIGIMAILGMAWRARRAA